MSESSKHKHGRFIVPSAVPSTRPTSKARSTRVRKVEFSEESPDPDWVPVAVLSDDVGMHTTAPGTTAGSLNENEINDESPSTLSRTSPTSSKASKETPASSSSNPSQFISEDPRKHIFVEGPVGGRAYQVRNPPNAASFPNESSNDNEIYDDFLVDGSSSSKVPSKEAPASSSSKPSKFSEDPRKHIFVGPVGGRAYQVRSPNASFPNESSNENERYDDFPSEASSSSKASKEAPASGVSGSTGASSQSSGEPRKHIFVGPVGGRAYQVRNPTASFPARPSAVRWDVDAVSTKEYADSDSIFGVNLHNHATEAERGIVRSWSVIISPGEFLVLKIVCGHLVEYFEIEPTILDISGWLWGLEMGVG